MIIMHGEAADNPYGQQAVAARYIYFCGTTPDCHGDTQRLLDFLAYYQAWRESGPWADRIARPPSQDIINTVNALMTGDKAYLEQIGLSGALEPGNEDMPFHFANVSPRWNQLLRARLGREPNDPEKNFWVLTIRELRQVCPSWGVNSPDMTKDETLAQCH